MNVNIYYGAIWLHSSENSIKLIYLTTLQNKSMLYQFKLNNLNRL